MLAPVDNSMAGNDMMGYISSMLIEEYEFMDIVLTGDKEGMRQMLSKNLKKYFNQYLARLS